MVVLAACGGAGQVDDRGAPGGAGGRRGEGRRPALLALLDRLPRDPPACVVADLGPLSARRRALAGLVSDASPIAWLPGAPWSRWVEARDASDPLGGGFQAFAPVPAGREVTLAFLRDAALPMGTKLGDCDEPWCLWPRFPTPDERLLVLARGGRPRRRVRPSRFGGDDGAAGSAGGNLREACRAALRQAPHGLVELTVRAEDDGPRRSGLVLRTVTADPRGLRVELRGRSVGDEIRTPEELAVLLGRELARDPGRVAVLPHRRDRFPPEVPGGPVRVVERYLWGDLELAAADQERLREAARAAAEGAADPAAVDLEHLPSLQEEIAGWEERIAEAEGPRRRRLAARLRRLLERAREEHPADPRLARALFRLLVDELDAPGPARAVAEDVLAARVDRLPPWRLLRREAAAGLDLAEGDASLDAAVAGGRLAELLKADGIIAGSRPGAASRAARSILAWRRGGAAHEVAEAAWLVEGSLGTFPRLGSFAPVDVPAGDLPVLVSWILRAALAAAPDEPPPSAGELELAVWGEGAGLRGRPARASRRAPLGRRGRRPGRGAQEEAAPAPVLASGLPGEADGGRFLGMAPLALAGPGGAPAEDPVWRLGDRLAEQVGEGRLRLAFGIRRRGAAEAPRRVLALSARADASGALHLDGGGPIARRLPWPRLDQDIVRGIAALERIFPEPALVFLGDPASLRDRIAARAASLDAVVCRPEAGDALRCTAVDRSVGPRSLERLLLEVLAARIPGLLLARLRSG